MHYIRPIFITFLFVVFSSSAFAQTVARVGNKNITLKEFKQKYDEIKNKTINPPAPEVFLEDLIRFEVGVQEAEKSKLQNDPLVKEQVRQVLYKFLVEKAIGKKVEKIKVNEKEMRKYYKSNPEVRTSHILIEFAPNATAEQIETARKRAKEIFAEVQKSKRPFAELVKLYTDDTLSKNTGGDIGYQSRVTLIPTYYDMALKMKVGQIRGIVRSRYGFHIIKLTGKRAYAQANKRQIRAAVFDQKRKKIFDAYFKNLKRNYKINVKKSLVKNLK